MVILASSVFSDWYEAARIAHVPYRVYVCKEPKDEAAKILRYATAMRCEDPAILCQASGRELWLFGILEPPPHPPSHFEVILQSKGTIVASSVSSSASADNVKPWAFLAAIRDLVITHACGQGYLPFNDCLYDPSDGSLIRILPALTIQGNLHLRLNREVANLRPASSKDTPLVYVVPTGRQARILDTVAVPPADLIQQFIEVLTSLYYVKLPSISEDMWFQLSCDSIEFIWPQSLTLSCQQAPLHLGWLELPDSITKIVQQTHGTEAHTQTPAVDLSKQHQHHFRAEKRTVIMQPPLPPPPPTPLAAVQDPVYLTPHYQSPERPVPSGPSTHEPEEEWEGEDEEVTVADFNYFDVPIVKDMPVHEEPVEVVKRALPNPLESSPHKRATGAFAPLDFNKSLDMDLKYLAGGRYFTPHEESDSDKDQEEDVKQEQHQSDQEQSDDDQEQSEPEQSEREGGDDDADVPDPWSFVADFEPNSFTVPLSRSFLSNSQLLHVDTWTAVLTSEPVPIASFESSEVIAELLKQVVWDCGSTWSQGIGAIGFGNRTTVSSSFETKLRKLFPTLQKIKIADSGSASTIAAQSRPMTPVIPGSEVVPQKLSETPQRNFTLLAPPLYSIVRMQQKHKARAAILRFWKTFGLQPIGGKRDIVAVNLALKSHVRSDIRRQFFKLLKTTYESCELGHLTLLDDGPVKGGIMEINADLDYVNPDTLGELFESSCVLLKRYLSEHVKVTANIMVVISWPANCRSSIIPAIRGYLALKSGFPNIRLRLYSRELDWSYPEENDGTSQQTLIKLALLWYDRWIPRYSSSPSSPVQPAFMLAQLVPHSINLRYEAKTPQYIFDIDPTMHIGYMVSSCRNWMTVSWTDQWATITRIEAIPLQSGKSSSVSSMMEQVMKQVWERTLYVCAQCPKKLKESQWRIAITKIGPMDADELSLWLKTRPSNLTNVLILSAGQPLMASDEILLPTAEDSDPDAIIVDAQDETQGIVFERKLYDLEHTAPVLAVGVFIRPVGVANEQLEIRLVYGTQVTKYSMKQVLGQFRRLASLAEHVGVSNTSLMPWHLTAVQKMMRVLYVV